MGRSRKYNTEEERLEAARADKRRWYHKVKEDKKEIFRLRTLRNYYKTKLEALMNNSTASKDDIEKAKNKIKEINDSINSL